LSTKRAESDVSSYSGTFGSVRLAQHIFSENYFKAMFSFHWISVLLISVTFYTLPISFFRAIWPLVGYSYWNFWKHMVESAAVLKKTTI